MIFLLQNSRVLYFDPLRVPQSRPNLRLIFWIFSLIFGRELIHAEEASPKSSHLRDSSYKNGKNIDFCMGTLLGRLFVVPRRKIRKISPEIRIS